LENLEGRDSLEDVGVACKIILQWILEKYDGRLWTGFIWLRIRDQWWALVNTVIIEFRKRRVIS
jgi:hypothetical protein